MAAILALELTFVWIPALASVGLSFTRWNGVDPLNAAAFIGLRNYEQLVTSYPRFWSALFNNALWLIALIGVAVPLGLAFAALLDRPLRGARLYQGALYLPMLLSLALVGLVWELQLSPDDGLWNGVLGAAGAPPVDWLGSRSLNRFVVLVPAIWRHAGYVMVLYLAGLRGIDPGLREAAEIDGAGELAAFFRVVLPALRPVTLVVLVVTSIQALRAFDIVYVLNGGLNGLELISVLITSNLVGEASRVGFGSAMATILLVASIVPIAIFLRLGERRDQQ